MLLARWCEAQAVGERYLLVGTKVWFLFASLFQDFVACGRKARREAGLYRCSNRAVLRLSVGLRLVMSLLVDGKRGLHPYRRLLPMGPSCPKALIIKGIKQTRLSWRLRR